MGANSDPSQSQELRAKHLSQVTPNDHEECSDAIEILRSVHLATLRIDAKLHINKYA